MAPRRLSRLRIIALALGALALTVGAWSGALALTVGAWSAHAATMGSSFAAQDLAPVLAIAATVAAAVLWMTSAIYGVRRELVMSLAELRTELGALRGLREGDREALEASMREVARTQASETAESAVEVHLLQCPARADFDRRKPVAR